MRQSSELQRAFDALWADDCPPIEQHEAPRRPPTQRKPTPARKSAGLLCISVRPPYATWLANPQRFIDAKLPPKTIENRSYDFTGGYRGPILIHQSKTFEHDALVVWSKRMPGIDKIFSMKPQGYPHGAIVGKADLVDVVEDSDDPWFVGEYGLVLANAQPVYPVAYRGQLGLFSVPANIAEQLEDAS